MHDPRLTYTLTAPTIPLAPALTCRAEPGDLSMQIVATTTGLGPFHAALRISGIDGKVLPSLVESTKTYSTEDEALVDANILYLAIAHAIADQIENWNAIH